MTEEMKEAAGWMLIIIFCGMLSLAFLACAAWLIANRKCPYDNKQHDAYRATALTVKCRKCGRIL